MDDLPAGTVTFLFTDIEGSTRLLDRLGDRYADVLAQHHDLLRRAFSDYGGREVDTQGDAFFVVFARARDAVSAAVAAQRALAAHAWPDGAPLRVRMGIHTGEPTIGADRYVGIGVHRAARICAAASGGQILVSAVTRDLVEGALPPDVALRDLGEHLLKDMNRADRLFQLVVEGLQSDFPALQASADPAAAPEPESRGFVGRRRELDHLRLDLDDVLAGRGRVAVIGGEPGIGKSRLADEVARHAASAGARVVWGRCWEAGGAPAYWPWVVSLRECVGAVGRDALRARLGARTAELAYILPELADETSAGAQAPADDESARFRLFDSTAALARAIADVRPLVLVLDDLQAADTPSLLLLRFVAREIGASRILILATYRDVDVEAGSPLADTVLEVSRLPCARRISLRGVGEADVEGLIEGATGVRVAPALARAIYEETEGNPLFIEELATLLHAESRLSVESIDDLAQLGLPNSVRDVIGRRLERLSEDSIRLLRLASVLGREFDVQLLERLDDSGAEVLDVLDETIEARVVAEVPGTLDRLRFAHALMREVLYEELSQQRRARLHRRAGELLEEFYAHEIDEHLAEIAHHYAESARRGDAARAVAFAKRAAERAAKLLAFEEAARLYQTALRVLHLEHASESERCELLLRLGDAQARSGGTERAKETFLAAADAARSSGDGERIARAALGYGGRFVWEAARGDDALIPLLEEALGAVGRDASALRARLLARLAGGPLRDDADTRRRDELSREAVELARETGDPATLAWVLDGRFAAVWLPDNLEDRIAIATELVAVAKEAGDKERELQGRHYRLLSLLEHGDMSAVYAELAEKTRLAAELRQPSQRWYEMSVRATLATFEGRFDDAETLAHEAFDLGSRTQGDFGRVYYLVHMYELRRHQRRAGELEQELAEAAERFRTYPVLQCIRADVALELGRISIAQRLLGALAADGFAALPHNDEWLYGVSILGDVAAELGDRAQARRLYDLLFEYADRTAVSAPDACRGAVTRVLGRLAASEERWEEARDHFEAALASNSVTGARPWLARTQLEYAKALLQSGRRGDAERARTLLDDATDLYEELGVAPAAEEARALAATTR